MLVRLTCFLPMATQDLVHGSVVVMHGCACVQCCPPLATFVHLEFVCLAFSREGGAFDPVPIGHLLGSFFLLGRYASQCPTLTVRFDGRTLLGLSCAFVVYSLIIGFRVA